MKDTETNQQAIQKAGEDLITKMWSKYFRMGSLGQNVTEDDLATHLEAEILACSGAAHAGRGPNSEPPHPTQTDAPTGAVLPFPQGPADLPLSA